MEFNLQKSQIYKAISFSKLLILGPLKFWRILFLIVGSIGVMAHLITKMLERTAVLLPTTLCISGTLCIPASSNDLFSGLAYIFLPLGFSVLFLEVFFNYYLKYPKIKDQDNLAELLDFDVAKILDKANSVSELLLAISGSAPAQNIFLRIGVNPNQLKGQLEKLPASDDQKSLQELVNLIVDANNIRQVHGSERITLMDLLASLFDFSPIFKQAVINSRLDKNDLGLLAVWYESASDFYRKRKMFWRLENLLRQPPIGIGWIYGYSWYLQHYATDLTGQFLKKYLDIKLIGRKRAVDQIEEVLSRSGQNNVLLVGEPGVGKRTVILGFVQMIAEGRALPALNFKRVFELNVPLIVSSSKDITEVQNTLILLLNEAIKAGNIILVIEDFHNFIGALGGMGRADISQILIPYLESTGIQIIATTDPVSFHKHIESRAEIQKVFEKVEVEEPNTTETLKIIEELVPMIEARNKIFLTYGAIKNIVEGADRYLKTAPMPEKTIDLLTEVVSRVASQKKPIVFAQDVDETITLKTEIPLGAIGGSEKEKLTNLEFEMHKEIIGQDAAVKAVAQTMQRLRAGLSRRGKPAGVFLFAGPTGVGKTLTAKILAKIYFGSTNKMIRFDMSEYQDMESLDRFLGSLRINEPGQLASLARDNPFSIILLDEIEKAHKNILNIFLAIFDEGKMTDVFGRKVGFEQNIFIATSNAAADLIRDMVNQGLDPSAQKEKVIDALVSGHYFSPEFLNRFDEVVIFHQLNQEQIAQIAELLVGGLAERLREQGYLFKPTAEIIDYISKIGFDPQFGARPMQRAIQDKLETIIARRILEGTIQKGQEFSLSIEELG